MKYLLFSYDYYYPDGGWRDFGGVFNTIEEAVDAGVNTEWRKDVVEVVDVNTLAIVKRLSLEFNKECNTMTYEEAL